MHILTFLFNCIILFTVLFDPAGLQLGLVLVNLSGVYVAIAQLIGNVTWVFGLIMLFVSMFIILTIDDREITQSLRDMASSNHLNKYTRMCLWWFGWFTLIVAFGSYYWFYSICCASLIYTIRFSATEV